jgi:hypothetical protein
MRSFQRPREPLAMPEYKVFLNQAAIDEFSDTLQDLKKSGGRPGAVQFNPKRPRPETCLLVLLAIRAQYREGDF